MKTIKKISVRNMTSKNSGREIPNQFIIQTPDGLYFQSYNTMIAAKVNGKRYLDKTSWDYSVTTGKYRNQFLNEVKKETERKIVSGEYELVDLN